MTVSERDGTILRDLAKRVAEIAADPVQQETVDLWKRLNRLERTRPPVLLHDGTQHETGHKVTLETEDDFARGQELDLRGRIYRWDHMRDDSIWEAKVRCSIAVKSTDYGIAEDSTKPDHVFGAKRFNTVIGDDEDPCRIPMPTVTVDWDETERRYSSLCDLYDGILTVEKRGVAGYWYAPLDSFITWRGIERTFMDMVDRPEWLHSWLERMCEFHLSELDQYEDLNVLSLNNGNSGIGSGGIGYTDELPPSDFDATHVRTVDQWGHATTQIFSEVSPAMHEEFALHYEKRFLARFGLANYGCCEPLDLKVDLILKHIPNVRRLSMSPKANVRRGAEALGRRAIFSYKPNPAIIGMETWDVEFARGGLRDALEETRGCVVEVIMKDLHTCRGEVRRMWEWIDMAKHLSEEYA